MSKSNTTVEFDAILELPSEIHFYGEFDPGSGRTLAACLIHASRADVLLVLAPI